MSVTALFLIAASCSQPVADADKPVREDIKIVSLNGTVTEILVELGLEDQIVGVDVASTYPASVKEKPKVGHNRNISAEGVLALGPDLIIGTKSDLKEETREQLSQTGLKILLFDHEFSVEGSKDLIRAVADSR